MKSDSPLVSIVILNWNSMKYIRQCVEGVLQQSYHRIEVVFVDNASSDESLKMCKERYPSFIFVENTENLGFTGGMNVGINHAKGDYVLLLNTDVFLEKDYVESCVRMMANNPEIACTAGWEYKWRNFKLTDEKVSGAWGISCHLRLSGTNDDDNYVFGVSGSFPMFRMSAVQDVIDKRGYFFDVKFGTGWEDTEVRFFMLYLGYKTKLNKETRAWHVGSASDNEHIGMFEKNLNYQERIFRNRMYVIDRYINNIFPLWSLYIKGFNIILLVYIAIFHHKSLVSYFRGRREFLNNKRHRIKQREILRRNMQISKNEVLTFIKGM